MSWSRLSASISHQLDLPIDDDKFNHDGAMDGTSAQPRDYQQRIVAKALAMFTGTYRNRTGELETPAHSVMVESPTGSGKTIMGLAVARQMQRMFGFSIGWVAMRRNLLRQAQEENYRWGFDIDLQPISMFEKNPPNVDMLVVDEAQHDAAMSMANLHCMIRPRKVLGLTATPFRTDRIKLCFDKVIRDLGIHQLIQDGYLSRYHHFTIPEYTPETVSRFLVNDPERWGKSLVFFHRLQQCDQCRDMLAAHGIPAEVVTATTDRERQLAAFSDGDIRVLINMSILTEGFDCPSLKTVFCRPSSKGCTIQMGGRVFRQHPSLPWKQIVQCKNTRHPFVKTAMADEQYVWLENHWRSLTLNREISAISDRVRHVIARAQITLPDLVAARRTRPLPWQSEA